MQFDDGKENMGLTDGKRVLLEMLRQVAWGKC
jgi:hypothetical protein